MSFCAIDQHLATDDGVQRDVEQQTGKHSGDWRRAFGVGIRQPVVQRHETGLGAVSDKQKDESQRQNGGFELILDGIKMRPQQCAPFVTENTLGGKIDQDGAE